MEVGNAGNGWNEGDGQTKRRTNGRKDGRMNGRKDGTYSAGVKDSGAVPSFNGTVVSFDLEGDREVRKGTLEGFRDGSWKECGKTERWDFT